MDKRDKYSIKQKELAVRSIIEGHQSISGASRELGCMRSAIKRWLAQYKKHGVKGFSIRNGSYDREFKLLVVRHYLGKKLSLNQTASFFNIPNESTIFNWVKIYEQSGVDGLSNKERGRKQSLMAKKSTKNKDTTSDPAAEKLAALERENAYLRAENAFLKKLEALVQEEKAAKARARQQKPSGN